MCRSSIMLGLSADAKQMPMTLPENMHRHANSRARVLVHSRPLWQGFGQISCMAPSDKSCVCFGTNMVTCCVLMGSLLFFKPRQISSLVTTTHISIQGPTCLSIGRSVSQFVRSQQAMQSCILHLGVSTLILQIFKSCGLRRFWGNGILEPKIFNHFLGNKIQII